MFSRQENQPLEAHNCKDDNGKNDKQTMTPSLCELEQRKSKTNDRAMGERRGKLLQSKKKSLSCYNLQSTLERKKARKMLKTKSSVSSSSDQSSHNELRKQRQAKLIEREQKHSSSNPTSRRRNSISTSASPVEAEQEMKKKTSVKALSDDNQSSPEKKRKSLRAEKRGSIQSTTSNSNSSTHVELKSPRKRKNVRRAKSSSEQSLQSNDSSIQEVGPNNNINSNNGTQKEPTKKNERRRKKLTDSKKRATSCFNLGATSTYETHEFVAVVASSGEVHKSSPSKKRAKAKTGKKTTVSNSNPPDTSKEDAVAVTSHSTDEMENTTTTDTSGLKKKKRSARQKREKLESKRDHKSRITLTHKRLMKRVQSCPRLSPKAEDDSNSSSTAEPNEVVASPASMKRRPSLTLNWDSSRNLKSAAMRMQRTDSCPCLDKDGKEDTVDDEDSPSNIPLHYSPQKPTANSDVLQEKNLSPVLEGDGTRANPKVQDETVTCAELCPRLFEESCSITELKARETDPERTTDQVADTSKPLSSEQNTANTLPIEHLEAEESEPENDGDSNGNERLASAGLRDSFSSSGNLPDMSSLSDSNHSNSNSLSTLTNSFTISEEQHFGQPSPKQRKASFDGIVEHRWQSNADLPDRRRMIVNISEVVKGLLPLMDPKKLPQMAKGLEERLYHSATTKGEYMDESTLKQRMNRVLAGQSQNLGNASHETQTQHCKASSSSPPCASTKRPVEDKITEEWRSNANDLSDRRDMIFSISDMIKTLLPKTDDKKVPFMAKALEGMLYRSAKSKAEYIDRITLKRRMNAALGTHPQQQQKKEHEHEGGEQIGLHEQSLTNATSARGWQSNNDLPDRRNTIFLLVALIKQMRPTTDANKLPHMAKRIEDILYKSALTREDYLNSATLKERLHKVLCDLLDTPINLRKGEQLETEKHFSAPKDENKPVSETKEPHHSADPATLCNLAKSRLAALNSTAHVDESNTGGDETTRFRPRRTRSALLERAKSWRGRLENVS